MKNQSKIVIEAELELQIREIINRFSAVVYRDSNVRINAVKDRYNYTSLRVISDSVLIEVTVMRPFAL